MRDGMKGATPHPPGRPARAAQRGRPGEHLLRRAAGEGEQEHPLGRHVALQQGGHPARQGAGLAGTGSGDDDERPVAVQRRYQLPVVEVIGPARIENMCDPSPWLAGFRSDRAERTLEFMTFDPDPRTTRGPIVCRMTGPPDQMLHSDAFAWYMEKDPVLRSTIVAVLRLESEPDWRLLRRRIDRLTRLVPRLRMRVQTPPLRLGPARWTLAEDFDLDYHLRRGRLPDRGGWADVLGFARTAAMADFDRARPLWAFTLLAGMADGGAALVTKLHHSLTDGIGGIQLVSLVVDLTPESPALVLPPPRDGERSSAVKLAVLALAAHPAPAAAAAGHAVEVFERQAVTAVRPPAALARSTAATARSVGRFVAPVGRRHSRILGKRRTNRFAATLDVPYPDLHDAAAAAGGRLNDAFLAAVTDAVHRYHEKRGATLAQVRVTVPVSLRTPEDGIG